MASVYASPIALSTVNGPMKRGVSLLAPRLVTAESRRPSVDNNTRSPFLNVLVFFLPRLSAFAFCLSTADRRVSRTNLVMA